MLNDPVAASFGRAARTYGEHAGIQERMAEWLAQWLPRRRQGRLLEAGAGTGLFTSLLLPWEGEVVATDASPAMVEAGRSRVPGVRWRTMRAEAPLAGPWDWVVSSSMLQWADDPSTLFKGWRCRMAPGGRILAGLFVEGSLGEWEALSGQRGPILWRSPRSWRRLLESAGWSVLREESLRMPHTYASGHAFLRALHRTGAAPGRRLAPARLRSLMGEYGKRYASTDGVIATWMGYRFEAQVTSP